MELDEFVKKYHYQLSWSEDARLHAAHYLKLPGISAHGNSAIDALAKLEIVVRETLKWMKEDSEELPKPLSSINRDEIINEAIKWVRGQTSERELQGKSLSKKAIVKCFDNLSR